MFLLLNCIMYFTKKSGFPARISLKTFSQVESDNLIDCIYFNTHLKQI